MYVNFPRKEKMHKCGCMLSGGDLDAVQTMWCQNPGYGSGWETLCELTKLVL